MTQRAWIFPSCGQMAEAQARPGSHGSMSPELAPKDIARWDPSKSASLPDEARKATAGCHLQRLLGASPLRICRTQASRWNEKGIKKPAKNQNANKDIAA